MEEKKVKLSTLFLILALIIIIVMGVFIFMLYKDKEAEVKKSSELQTQVNSLNGTVSQLQEKIKTISETVNTSTENKPEETNTTTENQSKTSSEQKTYNYTDIKEFWTNFRNAVLSYDYDEMKKYVKFPIEAKGPSDNSPSTYIKEEEFEETFKEFLQQTYIQVKDGVKSTPTEYDWIKEHEMPRMLGGTEYDNAGNYTDLVRLENDNSARFDEMVMEKDSNGYWKLTVIFI